MADISGYTKFTRYHAMAVMHAERIVTDLLEAIVSEANHPLKIAQFEGDSVLFYAEAEGDSGTVARDVLNQVRVFFDAFIAKARYIWTTPVCICDACRQVGRLRLKLILHMGTAIFTEIAGREHIGGADLDMLRALAKNDMPTSEYVLMTEAFYRVGGTFPRVRIEKRLITAERFGPLEVHTFHPEVPEFGAAQPIRLSVSQRLRQYIRVNGHAVLRWLRLRRGRDNWAHLPGRANTA